MGFKALASTLWDYGKKSGHLAKLAASGVKKLDSISGGALTQGLNAGIAHGLNHYFGKSAGADLAVPMLYYNGKFLRKAAKRSGDSYIHNLGKNIQQAFSPEHFRHKTRVHKMNDTPMITYDDQRGPNLR